MSIELAMVTPPGARWVDEMNLRNFAQYNWTRCRFCGYARESDCPPVACLLCGTVQCKSKAECAVCLHGWLPGWSRTHLDNGNRCGRKGCERPAVANVPRIRQACDEHAPPVKIRQAGRTVTLADVVADRLAERDEGGRGQHGGAYRTWRLYGFDGRPVPGSTDWFVYRSKPADPEDGYPEAREGWVGPFTSGADAGRECDAWKQCGWAVRRLLATPEVRARVDAWQTDADTRHGRPAQPPVSNPDGYRPTYGATGPWSAAIAEAAGSHDPAPPALPST